MNPNELPSARVPSPKGWRRYWLPSTWSGWICVLLFAGAIPPLVWGMITRSMAVERWAPRLLAAALIGSCLGVLAVASRGERSWIVWLVGPVPILAFVTGWILIRLGVLSMAGS